MPNVLHPAYDGVFFMIDSSIFLLFPKQIMIFLIRVGTMR